jgi:hypothetical protein
MNLEELYNQLKNSSEISMGLFYVKNLTSAYPESSSLSNEELLSILSKQAVIFREDLEIIEGYYLIGSTSYLKDGIDNSDTFSDFIEFMEGTRVGRKEMLGR